MLHDTTTHCSSVHVEGHYIFFFLRTNNQFSVKSSRSSLARLRAELLNVFSRSDADIQRALQPIQTKPMKARETELKESWAKKRKRRLNMCEPFCQTGSRSSAAQLVTLVTVKHLERETKNGVKYEQGFLFSDV